MPYLILPDFAARTILAHGVYLDEKERTLLRERKATVAHCPMSNSQLRSGEEDSVPIACQGQPAPCRSAVAAAAVVRPGMLNVRRLLKDDVHVALGTDVSGGASPSMLSAIREALKVSNMVSVYEVLPEVALLALCPLPQPLPSSVPLPLPLPSRLPSSPPASHVLRERATSRSTTQRHFGSRQPAARARWAWKV